MQTTGRVQSGRDYINLRLMGGVVPSPFQGQIDPSRPDEFKRED